MDLERFTRQTDIPALSAENSEGVTQWVGDPSHCPMMIERMIVAL